MFDKPYIAQPVVNVSMAFNDTDNITDSDADALFNSNIQYLVVNKSQNGFTILANKTPPRNLRFSWNALAIKDAKIYESVYEGLTFTPPAPEPEPQPEADQQPPSGETTNQPSDENTDSETDEEVIPPSTPEENPEVIEEPAPPEVTPEVAPEPTSEPTPEVIPEPTPEPTP